MNAWIGKGIILAILTSGMPSGPTWLILAIVASALGTMGLAQEWGVLPASLRAGGGEKR